MKEQDFYAPLIRGAHAEGWTLYRIQDGTLGKKPFDIGGITPTGRGVGLEVKLCKTLQFSEGRHFSLVETHQLNWLHQYELHGGLGIVCTYFLAAQAMVAQRIGYHPNQLRWTAKELAEGPLRVLPLNTEKAFYSGWAAILDIACW